MENIEQIVAKVESVVEELINGKPLINFVEVLEVKMKKYIVIWRKIGEERGSVVIITNDIKTAYEYAKKRLPRGKEAILYNGDKIEYQLIKA